MERILNRLFQYQERVSRNIVRERKLFLDLKCIKPTYFFSILILFSAFTTILSCNSVHSVFWLVLVFIQSAILFMLLAYEYLGLIIVIVYIGAIAILFLFVIMMLDIFQLKTIIQFNNMIPMILLAC